MAHSLQVLPFIRYGGKIPVMSDQKARKCVESILGYFAVLERAAMLRNDRLTRLHFEECWLTVCERFYGVVQHRGLGTLAVHQSRTAVTVPARPRWFNQKYSRPLRKVVGRITRPIEPAYTGAACEIHYDVLECGHQVEDNSAEYGARPARHRRCGQCSRANQQINAGGCSANNRIQATVRNQADVDTRNSSRVLARCPQRYESVQHFESVVSRRVR